MDQFIRRENIALFRTQLSQATTEEQRRVILQLLAEEEAKEGIVRVGHGEETRKTKDA
jgi:hypothetical protein